MTVCLWQFEATIISNVSFVYTNLIVSYRTGLFDLNHDLKKSLIYDFFIPIFLIADLYEFNTNNCLQASRSTKFCMFFCTKAQSAHTCVVVLSPDSLMVKYFMTLCMFELFPF